MTEQTTAPPPKPYHRWRSNEDADFSVRSDYCLACSVQRWPRDEKKNAIAAGPCPKGEGPEKWVPEAIAQQEEYLESRRRRTCRHCGATIERDLRNGWVDVVSGDDGGTFDICPVFDARTDDRSGGHQPTD